MQHQKIRATRGAAVRAAAVLALALGGMTITSPSALAADQPGAAGLQTGGAEEFGGYVGYTGSPDGVDPADMSTGGAGSEKLKKKNPTLADAAEVRGVDVPGQKARQPEVSAPEFTPPTAPDAASVDAVREALADSDRVGVIVMTDARQRSEAGLAAEQVRAQRAAIADSLDELDEALAGTGSRVVSTLESVPSAAYSITEDGLDALLDNPDVVSIVLDGEASSMLDSSTGVIDSDLLNAAGVRGNGFEGGQGRYAVSIIDSGVDGGHNAFAGKIVAQGCWVTDSSCLGGVNATTAVGSGEECTHSSDCDHGTHVAGIAAGSLYTGGHEGVADGAQLVALKVAQDNPTSTRWTAQFSSINSALQHTLNLRNGALPRLAAVNMSIGTSTTYAAGDPACNAVNPTLVSLMGQLQTAGVAVIVAAGNDGATSAMSFPGCATNAYAIGATSDADVPAGFTNSSSGLKWWAPGVSITAPVPTGTSSGTKNGTSMAAPHVAGAFALLRECVDGNGVPITKNAATGLLDATGVNVTRNGVTRKRINVLDAATSTVNNNDFAAAEAIPASPGAGFQDFDFNICSDTEPGEPGPFSLDNGVWWRWTPATTGTATISTNDGSWATTFDTTMAVYTGASLPTLNVVAFDDDSGDGSRSLVTFPVNGGTTYHIKVDGFAAQNGLINLNVALGAPPTCWGAPATYVGTAGDDTINGGAGNDVIIAGAGNDTINTLGGNDTICAGEGDDVVNAGDGNDSVFGGAGIDTIDGGTGDDTLLGNAGGGDVNDVGDVINGGAGNDLLDGWVGDDLLDGGPGNDQLRGEEGNDTVRYTSATGGVTVNLATQTATGGAGDDTLTAVENITGSSFKDTLLGDSGPNTILGAGGHDTLRGAGGLDVLRSGGGNDKAYGGGGDDSLFGQAGKDQLFGQAGKDHHDGGPGKDRCNGGPGKDTQIRCEVRVSIP